MQEKEPKLEKKLAVEVAWMYKYSNGQIALSDFKQPAGMNLKEENRR